MKLNNLVKSVLIVLPLLFLGACSSSSESSGSAGSDVATEEGAGWETTTDGVEIGGVQDVGAGEDLGQAAFENLQYNNVIQFSHDSFEIEGQYAQLLDTHATYLRDRPAVRVLIEGHTDEKGTPEYNIALGERRAKSVARYLQTLGVQAEQLSIVSYGEEKPLDVEQNDSAYSKNRRAVLIY